MPAALPAADAVPILPVHSEHLGSGAGSSTPTTHSVVPPPLAAAVPAPAGINYHQIEALVQRVMHQQQVPPPAGADAAGIRPVVEAAEPVLPTAKELEQEKPRLTSTQYIDRYLKYKVP